MRITRSMWVMKILPSPTLPVLDDLMIASTTWSTRSPRTATSMRVLGTKSTTYSAPRYSSVCPRCRPNPLTSVTVMPETPMSESAARTSSSLKGLMIAVTSFMWNSVCRGRGAWDSAAFMPRWEIGQHRRLQGLQPGAPRPRAPAWSDRPQLPLSGALWAPVHRLCFAAMYGQIVIVGAGQAAVQTADTLRRKGFSGQVALVGDEPHLPYQRPPLSKKYLTGTLERDRLLIRPAQFFADHKV